jgi:heme-binding NEAT domain protein
MVNVSAIVQQAVRDAQRQGDELTAAAANDAAATPSPTTPTTPSPTTPTGPSPPANPPPEGDNSTMMISSVSSLSLCLCALVIIGVVVMKKGK